MLDIIDNVLTDFKPNRPYAVIIGESPSKGARSPLLWNAAFKGLGIEAQMYPCDVRQERLGDLIEALKQDSFFIGGAVTMPYKTAVTSLLDGLEEPARFIQAVNCIYRKDGQLIGANTDGEAALWSLQQHTGDISGKTVLMLGAGGAGSAVAVYVARALGLKGKMYLVNRNQDHASHLLNRLKSLTSVEGLALEQLTPDILSSVDVLINTTSIGFEHMKKDAQGFYSLKWHMPLAPVGKMRISTACGNNEWITIAKNDIALNIVQSLERLSLMKKPVVMDIIYQPLQTVLLSLADKLGYQTINGLAMNLEQAVIAFIKANPVNEDIKGYQSKIRALMQTV